MLSIVLKDLIEPLSRRIGSIVGGALLGLGATEQLAIDVEFVVTAVVLFTADLLLSKRSRR